MTSRNNLVPFNDYLLARRIGVRKWYQEPTNWFLILAVIVIMALAAMFMNSIVVTYYFSEVKSSTVPFPGKERGVSWSE